MEWSPHGQWIATGGTEGRLRLFHATNALLAREFTGNSAVRIVRFNRLGSLLAAAEDSGTVTVRDVASGQFRWKVRATGGPVYGLDWNPAGDRLAIGDHDGALHLLRAEDGRKIKRWAGHKGDVRGLLWPAPDELISAGKDGALSFWNPDVTTGGLVRRHASLGHLRCLAATADGQRLAAGRYDGSVLIVGRADGRTLRELTGHRFDIRQVAWCSDGTQLASSSYDQTTRIGDVEQGRELKVIHGHTGRVQSVAWHPTAPRIATGGIDAVVNIWDTQGQDRVELGTLKSVRLRWNLKGDRLAAGDPGGRRVWLIEPVSGAVDRPLQLPAMPQSFCWHPDGTQLAIAAAARAVAIWNATGESLRQLTITNAVDSLDWSPDSRELAAYGTDGTLAILASQTGAARRIFRTRPNLHQIRWSRGGDQLILNGAQVVVLDAATGGMRHEFGTAADTAFVVAESSGTQHFAAAQWYRDPIQIWSAAGPEQPAEWARHTYTVLALDWHPTEARLASSGKVRIIRIWDTARARQVLNRHGHTADVISLAWSPDGMRLASASKDGRVRL